MRLRQRLGLRAGLALLAASSVLLGIALERVYVALFGQHLAVAVLPLGFLGAAMGALAYQLTPSIARPSNLLARLGYLACLAAATTLAALLIIVHTKAPDTLDQSSAGRLAAIFFAAAAPFLVIGAASAAVLRHGARDLGRLGFTGFAAAALAGPIAVALIRVGGPRLVLACVILDALAAVALYLGARFGAEADAPPVPRTRGGVVATAVLASAVLMAGDLGAPWLKVTAVRWGAIEKADVQAWTPLGLVTVDRPAAGARAMRLDGTATVSIPEAKASLPAAPDELPYMLRKDASPVAVLGAGAREVRVALKFSEKQIQVVEPNAYVVRALLRDKYQKYSGDVFDKPEVQVAFDDPRGYLHRSPTRFRTIVFPLRDTSAPAGLGALETTTSETYTVEAMREALDRLTPDGAVLVSRPDADVDRLFAVAVSAMRASGITDPAAHLFACGAAHTTSVLIARAALTTRELNPLRTYCRRNKFNEAFAPDQAHTEIRRRLTADPDISAAVAEAAIDLRPPTDDRPFYFLLLPPKNLAATLGDPKAMRAHHQGILVLAGLLAITAAGFLIALLLPAGRPARERGATLRPLIHHAAAAASIVLLGVALLGRLPLLLGHPGHALTTVQVALLGFAAAGSLLAFRVPLVFAERDAGYRAQILVVACALAAAGIAPIVGGAIGLALPARLGATVALLAPFGMLVGGIPALAVKIVASRTPELLPWCLSAAAAAGALAAVLGLGAAMILGYSAVILAAGAAALVAAASVPRAR